jgi:hypothetical protein
MLKSLKRLYAKGYALHWLHKKSKRPIGEKWSQGPRKTLEELERAYAPGNNLGVRLGSPSKIDGGFLAVIDCDVKSSDPKHLAEMEAKLRGLGVNPQTLTVLSGRGNGSRHLYVSTRKPCQPRRLAQSSEQVPVSMPSVEPSRNDLAKLSKGDIAKGLRLRAAWEISLMGEGQQVVVPPSIHPDSGKAYKYDDARGKDIAAFEVSEVERERVKKTKLADWEPVAVDLIGSSLSDSIVNQIVSGVEVEDRSAALFGVSIAMERAGFSEREILSVLTDKKNYLGAVAYDHTKSESRKRAAEWVLNFTLRKAKREGSARDDFEIVSGEEVPVDAKASAASAKELVEVEDWRQLLEKSGQKGDGPPKATLKNAHLILSRAVTPPLIKRDVFAFRDFYVNPTPWGGRADDMLGNDDAACIRLWMARKFRVEPASGIICEALAVIAKENAFDPVKEHLENLPAWDGVERLNTWLRDNFNAEGDEEYLAQVFRKWMVGMVRRVYEPGSKFDWMPIFEGAQGIGKSSFGRLLVGDKWFLDWLPDLKDKDAALGLQGIWLVEMGELTPFKKEIEQVKAFLTRTKDKVRPPYGKFWVESARRCVFFGTTNKERYFTDDTGNRRFKPVKVGQLNFNRLRKERDQLFAEALFIYHLGVETEVTLNTLIGDAMVHENAIQNEKKIQDDSDVMREQIQIFFEAKNGAEIPSDFDRDKFKISDLWRVVGVEWTWKRDNRNYQFASKALKSLGAKPRMIHGLRYWKYPKGGE